MRYQGALWCFKRREGRLRLLCISISKAGHYRADMLDINNQHVYHWLNPAEAAKLKSSGWLESNVLYETDDLIKSGKLKKLIEAGKGAIRA